MPDSITEAAKFSSRWVESRTFVRLQNLTVGYAIPPRYTASRPTRLYVSGNNLVLSTSYTGYDPEVFVASGLASRGIDYLVYPPARTFTLGARVQF
jgi:iron complex outermembrane receptor protein